MYKRHLLQIAVLISMFILIGFSAWAVPGTINYQGKLTDQAGISLDGYYDMGFYLYNAETDGNQLWSEQQNIAVTNGIYNVELGKTSSFPSDLFDNENLYLEVRIFSTSTGWETFSPRERITSTAFAMKAGDADTLDGYDSADLAATNHTHNGEDITSGIIDETYIDQTITRDSELAIHAAAPSAHHPKTTSFSEMTDMATDDQIPDNITVNYAKDSDKVDGKHASEFGDGHSLDAADGNPVDVVYVDEKGNVGIRTTSPIEELTIASEIPMIVFDDNSGPNIQRWYIGEGGSLNEGDFVIELDHDSDGSIDDTALYIEEANCNVGIGTTAPEAKLHVSEGNVLLDNDQALEWKDSQDAARTVLYQSSNNNVYLENHYDARSIVFRTTDGIIGERMRISNTGNVGIGTTLPSRKLDVAGNVIANAYDYHSDFQLKKNIASIDDALDKVLALRGVGFEWRIEEYPEKGFAEGRKIGLIAQDVEQVVPEVVSIDNEGYKSVEYGKIVSVLIEAIKAQQAQIEGLKARIEVLEQ